MTSRPLLTLSMIVRDGGAGLARCLDSVQGLVDEIVVVDTGSRDQSVQVAESRGARVLHFPWSDDFSAARNRGLEACRGRWILFLDADEVLDPPSPVWLRRQLQEESSYLGYYLPLISNEGEGTQSRVTILRLFRASERVRFRYPIHEQVLPDLLEWARETGLRFGFAPEVRILHDGYLPEEIRSRGKVERNLRLFDKALVQYPEEPFLAYKYADYVRGIATSKEQVLAAASSAYDRVRDLDTASRRKLAFLPEILALLCAALLETGQRGLALELLQREPPEIWRSPHYDYVSAITLEAAGRLDEAQQRIQACFEPVDELRMTAVHGPVVGHLGECVNARLFLKRGDAGAAEAAARRAAGHQPGHDEAWCLWADALAAQGDPGGAIGLLTGQLRERPSADGVCEHLGLLMLQLRHEKEAIACLARIAPSRRRARILVAVLAPERLEEPLGPEDEALVDSLRSAEMGTPPTSSPQDPLFAAVLPYLRPVHAAR